jgi:hypothetical protein
MPVMRLINGGFDPFPNRQMQLEKSEMSEDRSITPDLPSPKHLSRARPPSIPKEAARDYLYSLNEEVHLTTSIGKRMFLPCSPATPS